MIDVLLRIRKVQLYYCALNPAPSDKLHYSFHGTITFTQLTSLQNLGRNFLQAIKFVNLPYDIKANTCLVAF